MPEFSIITATFNSAESVASTIKSIKEQSYNDYEVLFIDGASTDNTVDIIREHTADISDRIKIVSEADKGIYDALNKGLNAANGEIISFLHADDFYASTETLKKVSERFKRDSSGSVYGDLLYVGKGNTNKVIRHWQSGECTRRKLKRGWMPPHPSFFVKKSIYEKYGAFDVSLKIAADYDFMMRVLFKENISTSYLPEVLVKMRVGGVSNKSLKNILRKSREDLIAMKKNELGGFISLVIKNIRKLPQFFFKG